ncbi:restriction endonuclease, partial [Thomasclavelia cocleata]
MKLIILWLINTVIVLPLKTITYIFKLIFKFINNIYFYNLDWEYINTMKGHEFEYFTKILLEKNGFKQVTVSQSSNDYGIDVLATKNKYRYAIQCKRYNQKVGIKAVQEAKSGCDYYQCDIPVVFTNNTFSPAAIKLAKNINVELWDKDTLHHYLKKSKLLTKSLPFYYPLISFLIIILSG